MDLRGYLWVYTYPQHARNRTSAPPPLSGLPSEEFNNGAQPLAHFHRFGDLLRTQSRPTAVPISAPCRFIISHDDIPVRPYVDDKVDRLSMIREGDADFGRRLGGECEVHL